MPCIYVLLYELVFLEKKYLLYVKPLATISLIILYLDHAKTKNVFVIISLLVIIATDTFTYIDFEGYFERIASLITVFYSFCVFYLVSAKYSMIAMVAAIPLPIRKAM